MIKVFWLFPLEISFWGNTGNAPIFAYTSFLRFMFIIESALCKNQCGQKKARVFLRKHLSPRIRNGTLWNKTDYKEIILQSQEQPARYMHWCIGLCVSIVLGQFLIGDIRNMQRSLSVQEDGCCVRMQEVRGTVFVSKWTPRISPRTSFSCGHPQSQEHLGLEHFIILQVSEVTHGLCVHLPEERGGENQRSQMKVILCWQ